jgi:hypothetical protein
VYSFLFLWLVKNWSIMKCLEFVSYNLHRPNVSQPICESNSSLFVLIGNPGVIWHPESNQCLHITLHTLPAGYGDYVGSGTLNRFVSFFSLSVRKLFIADKSDTCQLLNKLIWLEEDWKRNFKYRSHFKWKLYTDDILDKGYKVCRFWPGYIILRYFDAWTSLMQINYKI